jgi:hypothetical protein
MPGSRLSWLAAGTGAWRISEAAAGLPSDVLAGVFPRHPVGQASRDIQHAREIKKQKDRRYAVIFIQ